MVRINIKLEDDLHRKAKSYSALKGITLVTFINEAVRQSVEQKNNLKFNRESMDYNKS